VNVAVLFAFVMNHQQLEVVACVENKVAVYQAFFCSFTHVIFGDGEKGFWNNVVTS
jgi:hypothetical protein